MERRLEVGVLHLLQGLNNVKKTKTLFSHFTVLIHGHHIYISRHDNHIQKQENQGNKRLYACLTLFFFFTLTHAEEVKIISTIKKIWYP